MNGLTTMAALPEPTRFPPMPECKLPREERDREIRFLGDLQRINPKPGDVFALSVDADLSVDQVERIRESWKQVMGDIPVIVLCRGVRLEWLASSAPPADPPMMNVRVGAHHIGITK